MKDQTQSVTDGRTPTRYTHDLSHFTFQVGYIGGLQTLSVVRLLPGDSIALDLAAVFRLSPLRKNLYMDCRVDLFAFYIPDRHIYPTADGANSWVNFIKAGNDEGVTLGTDTLAASASLQCCGGSSTTPAAVLPRWRTRGYIQIYNRYFRDPSDTTTGDLAENYFTTLSDGDAKLVYGLPCCHLKRIWNTAVLSTLTAPDYTLAAQAAGEVDLYSFASLQGHLKTEQDRDFFGIRYSDIVAQTWGGHANTDADPRPTLIARSSTWMSGYDVDGTDDATLGTYAGKGQGTASLRFPSKFIPEHGTLWIMALLRFPPVHYLEHHYLDELSQPTYKQISGDPALYEREKPVDLLISDLFVGGGATSLGNTPYGQWYREHPTQIHARYVVNQGHPFLDQPFTTRVGALYITSTMYDNCFFTLQMKHWNCQGFVGLTAKRYIPGPLSSIFAATGESK